MQQTHQCSTRSYHFHQKVLADILAVRVCVCVYACFVLCNTYLCVYQEVCLTLNAQTFSVTMFDGLFRHYNIPYMSQCARKQQHLLFSLISVEGKRMKKEK